MKKTFLIILFLVSKMLFAQQISSGNSMNFVIKTDGTLWSWGDNYFGALGVGANAEIKNSPTQIGSSSNWKLVSSGGRQFATALKNDGTLWAWGANWEGELGNGTNIGYEVSPIQIGNSSDWKLVSSGAMHTMAIKNDGTLWGWGNNWASQLGDGTIVYYQISPKQIGSSSDWETVSSGVSHTMGIKNDGTLWSWGNNTNGQLGDGTTLAKTSPTQIGTSYNWKNVQSADNYSLALKNDGTLWAWGANSNGQLGDGNFIDKKIPTQIGNSTDWKSIVTQSGQTVAIKNNNTLWFWGNNGYGLLGNGFLNDVNTPSQIGTDIDWESATIGLYHIVAMKTNYSLFAWGSNLSGQLGDGNESYNARPKQVGSSNNWKSVYAGTSSGAIKNDGTLWTWGSNMGDGTTICKNSPTQIGIATNWKTMSVSYGRDFAVKTDGSLWAWGDNSFGLLGDGTSVNKLSPVQIGSDFNDVFTGLSANFAIKTDSSLWGWGYNSSAQIGDGTTIDKSIPTIINGIGFTKIANNYGTTISVKLDGSLWNWGYLYGSGQNYNSGYFPVQNGTVYSWNNVAAGWADFMGLKNDGTLWTWGQIYSGESNDPIRIDNTADFKDLSTGAKHSLFIKNDGTLWSRGDNSAAQLGNGSASSQYNTAIIKIGTDTDWKAIAAGERFSLAIKNNGTLWSWGEDDRGQLGNGFLYVPKSIQFNLGCSTPAAPIGNATQTFKSGDMLSNLSITGSNLNWYDADLNKITSSNTTLLLDGSTYYVSQTVNGCEGFKLSITVTQSLGIDQNKLLTITYNPNPVNDLLFVKSNEIIENVSVYNELGQLLFTQPKNSNDFNVDLSNLSKSNYFIKVQGEQKQNVFKVIKK